MRHPRRALLAAAATLAVTAPFTGAAYAQAYPAKPITFVVPNPPGGVVDTSARLLGDPLAKLLGQSVVIENKGGASGNIAYGQVAKAPADGYTLLISYSAYHVGNPSMFSKMPWAQKDFVPVALLTAATNVIAAHPSVAPNTLKDFIGYVKANPGKLNYASFSLGSTSHLVAEMLAAATGTKMNHIPFKGSADASVALIGGQVDFLFDGPTTALAAHKGGRVKMLAYTDPKPYQALGNLPNMAQAGYPGVDVSGGMQFFGPKGMTPELTQKVNAALAAALKQPDVQKMFVDNATEVVASTAPEHAVLVKELYERFGEVIRRIGLKLD